MSTHGARVRRSTFQQGALCACLLLVAGCAENGPSSSAAPDAEASRPVAEVNGHVIALDQVDDRIKQILFDDEFGEGRSSKLHDARMETIGDVIDEQLVEAAAASAGMDSESWIEQQMSQQPPVSDEDVAAFFEANKARFGPGATQEGFDSRIRGYLEHQREQQVIANLRESASISITLGRARQQVAPSGYSIGPADAPVVMIEFSDYQCPYCARVEPTVKQLIERYPDELRVVYRHHPLPFHPNARLAAQAAVCAGQQDAFWAYHEVLFANQKALGRPQLLAYAEQQTLDIALFEACLDSPETNALIEADIADADELDASGTPTFFINGIMLSGARPIEDFVTLIDEELKLAE